MSSEGGGGGGEEEDDEERLCQMVRDYIELESSNSSSCFPSMSLVADQKSSTYRSLQEILGNFTASEAEILGKIRLYSKDLESTTHKKWIVLCLGLALNRYQVCLCTTSWVTTSPCPSVFKYTNEYEYIEVIPKNENGEATERLIVDIDFRSQFELARPTTAYAELWNSLPQVFVGTEAKLEKIVSFLSSAAKASLKERGLHIPPWRKESYMQSKWLSQNCSKVSFLEIAASLRK